VFFEWVKAVKGMENFKKPPPAEANVFFSSLCSCVYTNDFDGILSHSGVSKEMLNEGYFRYERSIV
jgi:hypothetical protein